MEIQPNHSTHHHKEEKTQQFLTAPQSTVDCRICLDTLNNAPPQTIVSPCSCNGSLKFIHKKCLKLWISKLINKQEQQQPKKVSKIRCELCKEWIEFETEKVTRCRTIQEIRDKYRLNKKTFFIFLVILLVNLTIFGALLNYLLLHGFKNLGDKNAILIILIITAITIIGLVIIILGYFFIRNFLFISTMEVSQFMNVRNQVVGLKGKTQQKYIEIV